MAKGNMLLGQSRGKIGDVVFTRMNGEQIARPRVRHPRNPQTNKQLYQRAIMATVMQAYSSGIEIFDHSFEGKAVGAENQRYFMKINAKKLRADIVSDLNAAEYPIYPSNVVAPGVNFPVPNKMQVSEGSLVNSAMPKGLLQTPNADETCASYCARCGFTADDLFTLVAFASTDFQPIYEITGVADDLAKQITMNFYYYRIRIKASALADNTVLTNSNLGIIFDETSIDTNIPNAETIDNWAWMGGLYPGYVSQRTLGSGSAYAVIRSKYNSDLRSTEVMEFDNRYTPFGIASKYALQAWKQGTQALGDSDLILEGGDI